MSNTINYLRSCADRKLLEASLTPEMCREIVQMHDDPQVERECTSVLRDAKIEQIGLRQQAELQRDADALLRTMDRAGWSLDWFDIDLTGSTPKLEILATRYDGLWVRAYVDQLGRATLERFQRERGLEMNQHQKGRRPLVQQVDDHFMGRQRYEGGRSMMRGLCAYLTDNALHPVALADMRAAWAALMQEPARIAGAGASHASLHCLK